MTLLHDCCQAAERCCDQIKVEEDSLVEDDSCPPTWDGWQCWGEGRPGLVSTRTCPEYIYFFTHGGHKGVGCDSEYRLANKVCVYVCVCVCACIRASMIPCVLACVLACVLVCVLAYVLACILACVLACVLACILACVLVCVLACVFACVLACILACVLAWVLTCILACVLACLCVRPCVRVINKIHNRCSREEMPVHRMVCTEQHKDRVDKLQHL